MCWMPSKRWSANSKVCCCPWTRDPWCGRMSSFFRCPSISVGIPEPGKGEGVVVMSRRAEMKASDRPSSRQQPWILVFDSSVNLVWWMHLAESKLATKWLLYQCLYLKSHYFEKIDIKSFHQCPKAFALSLSNAHYVNILSTIVNIEWLKGILFFYHLFVQIHFLFNIKYKI